MDILTYEYDRDAVVAGLQAGELDYLEPVTEGAEAEFFRDLLGRPLMDRLVENYPTPRKKEEVPIWMYLSSQISLRLHGTGSYHAFPYVLRTGGLISALGPAIGRKAVHPLTKEVTVSCAGFNEKNMKDRQTPCDQDFLRKFARDTDRELLQKWFNREVPRALRGSRLLDAEGIYIGDGSYVFVPDNEHYEGSALLLFDEHNHPVEPSEVDLKDKRYQWKRCYKLVSLIHTNRNQDFFFVVGARLLPGNAHECPVLYQIVDEVVEALGRGWIRILILDRGFIDGEQIGRLKTDYQIDTAIPLRTNMDAYHDAIGLTRLADFTWEPFQRPVREFRWQKNLPQHPTILKREAKRQQTLAARKGLPPPPPPRQPQTLLGTVPQLTSWTSCPVPLMGAICREIDSDGEVKDWVLVTTASDWSASKLLSTYELRTSIEERHRQYKCFWDLSKVTSRAFSLVAGHVIFVLLTYTLLQVFLFRKEKNLTRQTRLQIIRRLGPTLTVVAVYHGQKFCLLSLPDFAEILLQIEEQPRAKLLKRVRELRREIYSLLANPRPP